MKYRLRLLFLLTLPASATISYVRSAANWTGTSSTECDVSLGTTGAGDLLAVWAEWQTSSGPNTVTITTTQDAQSNTLNSAVGPTVQSVSNTAAQVFYVKSILSGGDGVKLNFSGTVASSACVTVEYSGADTMYPLDSASAGYSTATNPTGLLDSGNVAPANSNLMVFAGGIADNTSTGLIAGSGFTSLQSSHGSWGTGIVETSTAQISGNSALQRATACVGISLPCTAADWVMQMAVFRDASWTVQSGRTPVRPFQIRDATQFPGVDIGDQVNHAYADLPATGGQIVVPGGPYTFAHPITFTTLNKPALLTCANSTATLTYLNTTGAAITLDWGFQVPGGPTPPTGSANAYSGVIGCSLVGSGGTSSAGIQMGPNNGTVGTVLQNNQVTGFYNGLSVPSGKGAFLLQARGNFFGLNINAGVDLAGPAEDMDFTSNCFCNNNSLATSGTTGYGFLVEHGASIFSLSLVNNSFDTNYYGGFVSAGLVVAKGHSNHFEDNVLTYNVNGGNWENFINLSEGQYMSDGDTMTSDVTGPCTGMPIVCPTTGQFITASGGAYVELANLNAGTSNSLTNYLNVTNLTNLDSISKALVIDPIVNAYIGTSGTALFGGSGYYRLEQTNPGFSATGDPYYTYDYYNGAEVYALDKAGVVHANGYDYLHGCAAVGTGANPSVASCGVASAGAFSCDPASATGSCVVNTTAVTANSLIFIQANTSEGSVLGITCNTAADTSLTVPRVASKSAGTSFTINVGSFSAAPECFDFQVVN